MLAWPGAVPSSLLVPKELVAVYGSTNSNPFWRDAQLVMSSKDNVGVMEVDLAQG